jgi:hypothetical protein
MFGLLPTPLDKQRVIITVTFNYELSDHLLVGNRQPQTGAAAAGEYSLLPRSDTLLTYSKLMRRMGFQVTIQVTKAS